MVCFKYVFSLYCVVHRSNKTCATEYDDDTLSSEKILRWLSDPCRYDKTTAPRKLAANIPIVVSTRIHVYHLTSVYPRNLVRTYLRLCCFDVQKQTKIGVIRAQKF